MPLNENWLLEPEEKNAEDYLKAVKETVSQLEDCEHAAKEGIYWEVIPGKRTDEKGPTLKIGNKGCRIIINAYLLSAGSNPYTSLMDRQLIGSVRIVLILQASSLMRSRMSSASGAYNHRPLLFFVNTR